MSRNDGASGQSDLLDFRPAGSDGGTTNPIPSGLSFRGRSRSQRCSSLVAGAAARPRDLADLGSWPPPETVDDVIVSASQESGRQPPGAPVSQRK